MWFALEQQVYDAVASSWIGLCASEMAKPNLDSDKAKPSLIQERADVMSGSIQYGIQRIFEQVSGWTTVSIHVPSHRFDSVASVDHLSQDAGDPLASAWIARSVYPGRSHPLSVVVILRGSGFKGSPGMNNT